MQVESTREWEAERASGDVKKIYDKLKLAAAKTRKKRERSEDDEVVDHIEIPS